MTTPLHISDSGWRAVIADGFTVPRLSAVAAALAELFPAKHALLGFDNRFLSEACGHHVAALLSGKGWRVDLIPEIFPTPGVAKLVRDSGGVYDFGLEITASHNPYYYNGLKILDARGGLIDRDAADRLEKAANGILSGKTVLPFDPGRRFEPLADATALSERYLDAVLARVDAAAIRSAKLTVAWDAFGGTVAPLFPKFLDRLGARASSVPTAMEPTYGRRRLEPDAPSLRELESLAPKTGAIAGLATDVDGDRFSAVDETGAYVPNNPLGSLMVWYLLAARGERGTVYQTVSCSAMTERICAKFGAPLKIEPVGFMKMGRDMAADASPLIGIEETGGMAYGPHLPFKDGLMAHALLLEMLATRKKTIPALLHELEKKYGRFHYRRIDLKLPSEAEVEKRLDPALWERRTGESIAKTSTLDGVKWTFPSGWVLIRRSKTEPLLRIYFESEDASFVERVAREAV